MLLAIVYCLTATRQYKAKCVVQFQKSSSGGLDLDSLLGGGGSDSSDGLSANLDLQTQATILQSETLALRTIKDLNLATNTDFQPHFSLIGWVFSVFTPKPPAEPANASLDESPRRRKALLDAFAGHLKVRVVAGTRLIEINFTNSDPKVAAAVVNYLEQSLVDYTFQAKFSATSEASRWLENQLGDLRQENENLQTRVVDAQKKTGLFGVGGMDEQGKSTVYSPVLGRLQQSTADLSAAQMNRILKGSIYSVVRSGNAELISQLSGTGLAGSNLGSGNSLSAIQALRANEAALQTQIAQDETQFGPNYPKLIEERASLRKLEQAMQEEIARIAAKAKNDYDVAVKTEEGARKIFESDKEEADRLNDKTIEYGILQREASQSQNLYQDLLKKLKEAGILDGLKASNITVVDPGRVPSTPSSPRTTVVLFLGFFGGGLLGLIGAWVTDEINNTVLGPEDVEAMHLPMLGMLPQFPPEASGGRKLSILDKNSSYAESMRAICSSIRIVRSGTPPKVLLVVSSTQSEGKSTTAINLAASLARFGNKVLLLEADMRRPVMRNYLSMKSEVGLSSLLADSRLKAAPTPVEGVEDLWALPAGEVPLYPAELLGSQRMKELIAEWSELYDYIILDSPPVVPVSDPRILMSLADMTIMVVRVGVSTRAGLHRAYSLLAQHAKNPESPAIGVLVNAISMKSSSYYGYYGYYGKQYRYYYGGNDEKKS
jgi:capsular exopolysaccharide synthesis family protein